MENRKIEFRKFEIKYINTRHHGTSIICSINGDTVLERATLHWTWADWKKYLKICGYNVVLKKEKKK